MAEGDTFVNALIGAAASFFLSGVIPFAPLFGGGIAGYMQGGDRNEGLRVGAISGLLAAIPAFIAGLFFFGFVASVLFGGAMTGMSHGFAVFGTLSVVGLAALAIGFLGYFVGLSAAGGWIGNYVKYDTDFEV